jgi:hypothetical protein
VSIGRPYLFHLCLKADGPSLRRHVIYYCIYYLVCAVWATHWSIIYLLLSRCRANAYIYIIFHYLYLYLLYGVCRVGHTFHLFILFSYHLFNLHLYIIIIKLLIVISFIYITLFHYLYYFSLLIFRFIALCQPGNIIYSSYYSPLIHTNLYLFVLIILILIPFLQ